MLFPPRAVVFTSPLPTPTPHPLRQLAVWLDLYWRMRGAGGGGQGTQSACEVLWPNRMGFLNLYLSFPRVRGCGERGGSQGGGG